MTVNTETHQGRRQHRPIPPRAVHTLVDKGVARAKGVPAAEASVANLLLRAACLHSESGVRLFRGDRDEEGAFRSYTDLLDEAQRILGGLQTCGHFPGETIVLLLERTVDLVPALWACLLGGYVPCP